MIRVRTIAILLVAVSAAGCSTLQCWIPSLPTIPPPSQWFGKGKPGPLPPLTIDGLATAQLAGERRQGRAGPRAGDHAVGRLCCRGRRIAGSRRSRERPRRVARQRGHAHLGRARRGRPARDRRHLQGRRAGVRRRRQCSVDGARLQRSDRAAAHRRGRRRRVLRRRPHLRAQRRRRPHALGHSAHAAAADDPQHGRRRHRARRCVRRNARRPPARDRPR